MIDYTLLQTKCRSNFL